MQYSNPLIVQSDKTLLLDVHAPLAEECRNALIAFAELERSPEHLHTYRLSPLSLWNASSAGISTEQIIESLEKFAKYIAEKIYKHFGDSSGGMILATSITGTLLSSLAQTGAILFNDKYTTSQKTFMAPQELTEGLINVLSMFLITTVFMIFSKKQNLQESMFQLKRELCLL